MIDILLRIAATWLIAYSLVHLDGPLNVFKWIREHIPHGGLLSCIVCTATWIGVIVMLMPDGALLQGFGVAGVALWVHKYSGWSYNA